MGSHAHPGIGPTAAIAAGLLILAGCGGTAPRPAAGLTSFTGCGDLLAGLRAATAAHVTPYGLAGDPIPRPLMGPRLTGAAAPAAGGPAGAFSATNVQEPGVDEPDLVKTDGRRIVTVAAGRLRVVDVASRRQTGTLDLRTGTYAVPGATQLLMHGDRVLIIGRAPLFRPLPVPPAGPVRGDAVRGGSGHGSGSAAPAPVPSGASGRPAGPGRADGSGPGDPMPVRPSGPRLILVDVSGAPRVIASLRADGAYVDARQRGSVARVVVRSAPAIRFPARPGATPAQATAANREVVRHAPLDAWLPHYTVTRGGVTRDVTLPCGRLAHPPSYTGTSVLSVLTVDLSGDLRGPAPLGVLAGGDTVYGTAHTLYVTDRPGPAVPAAGGTPAPAPRTAIYRFDLGGAGRPRFTAAGSVPGEPLGAYALSEYAGYLRVATTAAPATAPPAGPPPRRHPGPGESAGAPGAGGTPPSSPATATPPGHAPATGMVTATPPGRATTPGDAVTPGRAATSGAGGMPGAVPATDNAVYVLARHGDRLVPVGVAGGLGRGERIQAVRFIGPAGYVVTFRRTDPLYVLDLRDPRHPRVTGQLTISGYSAYLHPVGAGLLLGVGPDTGTAGGAGAAAATLFDVRDPALPRRVGAVALPGETAAVEYDPHAFLFTPAAGLAVLPVGGPGGDRAVVLSVTPGGVRHAGDVRVPGDAGGIERVLLAGGALWTLCPAGLQVNDATTLARTGWTPFA